MMVGKETTRRWDKFDDWPGGGYGGVDNGGYGSQFGVDNVKKFVEFWSGVYVGSF